jgi:hypothetical protein
MRRGGLKKAAGQGTGFGALRRTLPAHAAAAEPLEAASVSLDVGAKRHTPVAFGGEQAKACWIDPNICGRSSTRG